MASASKKKSKKSGARIPERAEDMPGGPDGGTPITPPQQPKKKTPKKKTKKSSE